MAKVALIVVAPTVMGVEGKKVLILLVELCVSLKIRNQHQSNNGSWEDEQEKDKRLNEHVSIEDMIA